MFQNTPHFYLDFKDSDVRIKYIEASYSFSLCIDTEGGCYLFGLGDKGQIGNGQSGDGIKAYKPFKINDNIDDEIVVGGSIGDAHTILLTASNNVIVFGDNGYHQCSSLMDETEILTPYIVSKTKEIGILETSYVERVMALNDTTVIFVNPNKNVIIWSWWESIQHFCSSIFEDNFGFPIAERHIPIDDRGHRGVNADNLFIINTNRYELKNNILRGYNGIDLISKFLNIEIEDANEIYYNDHMVIYLNYFPTI